MTPKKEKELIEKIVEAVPEEATYSGAKNIYKTTERMRILFDVGKRLESMYPTIIRVQRVWDKPISVKEKLSLIEAQAKNQMYLLEEIFKEYPEIEGKDIEIGLWKITVKE